MGQNLKEFYALIRVNMLMQHLGFSPFLLALAFKDEQFCLPH